MSATAPGITTGRPGHARPSRVSLLAVGLSVAALGLSIVSLSIALSRTSVEATVRQNAVAVPESRQVNAANPAAAAGTTPVQAAPRPEADQRATATAAAARQAALRAADEGPLLLRSGRSGAAAGSTAAAAISAARQAALRAADVGPLLLRPGRSGSASAAHDDDPIAPAPRPD